MAKLTTLLILISLMQVSAKVYSQAGKLDLSIKKATILQVFDEIEDNSSYRFFYDNEHVDLTKEVSIESTNQEIAAVLQELFEGTDLTYQVNDHLILVQSKIAKSNASAQQHNKITGKVTDEGGLPLPGVTILVKGTSTGTVTNIDGEYTLADVPAGATLAFSFVGMRTQEVLIENQNVINITLVDEAIGLDDVIVIGYGTTKRKDFTGSVSSVSVENSAVSQLPNTNALEAIKGNVTGLNIGASNSAGDQPDMLIRGTNSISGDNDPLIILDGVIYLGSLSDINPNDIASVDVLKDAVSAAVYGSRSANGVIAINTKRGKSQKPVVSFNTSTGVQLWQYRPNMMKGEQWIEVINDRNGYSEGDYDWMTDWEEENYLAGSERDWLDDASRTGTFQNYQVSVSGAGKGLNYYLSSSYNKTKGVVVGDDFERISILGKINTNITDWLKIGIDGSFSQRDYSGFSARLANAKTMTPYGRMYRDDEGNLEKYPYEESNINPLWGVNDGTRSNSDIRQAYRLNSYISVDIPWIKGLNYRLNYLNNYQENNQENFYHESYYVSEGSSDSRYDAATLVGLLKSANGDITTTKTSSYVLDNILSFKRIFGKHNVEVTMVYTRDRTKYQQVELTGDDFTDNGNTSLGISGLAFATNQYYYIDETRETNIGYLARFNYSFDDKYLFTGSYRRDGASVFGSDNKWGNFFSFGAGWRITKEDFMPKTSVLNDLKLKVSIGQNGNQGVSAYSTLSQITNGTSSSATYEFSDEEGEIQYGLYQTTLGNQELGWEKTTAWNAGFESAWLNNRLFVDLDLYLSSTTDQLFYREIPVMSGFKYMWDSMGEVQNKGIEANIRTTNIRTKDFSWSSTISYWLNRNKIIHLYGEDNDGDGKEDDDSSNGLYIGESINAIYGYVQDGIIQSDDTEYILTNGDPAGNPKYKDLDGDGTITTEDRKILGTQDANFKLSFGNTLSYKNFTFYALISGIFGGNGYYQKSNTPAYTTNTTTGRAYDNTTYKPYWTEERASNKYPRAPYAADSKYLALQSRGFVRLQDVNLSYDFGKVTLKRLNINSLTVYLSGKNLITFTNWDGGDPELGNTYTTSTQPVMSTYTVGAKISF